MNSKTSDQTPEGRTRVAAATSLGEKLRLAREQRGVSLREISDQTRISMRYLEAIEADDYKRLPGGIFNRSFIRSYARYVKFDEKEAVDAYANTAHGQGETAEEESAKPQRSRIYMDSETARSPLVTWLLSIIILGILILGVYAGLHFYRRTDAPAPRAANDAAPAGSAPAAAANNDPAAQNSPPAQASAPAASGFQVQVKAKGEPVWVRVKVDDGDPANFTLDANATRDFAPASRLSVSYSKSKADALEVTINGRPAKPPVETKGTMLEISIPKEGYEQFLQQP